MWTSGSFFRIVSGCFSRPLVPVFIWDRKTTFCGKVHKINETHWRNVYIVLFVTKYASFALFFYLFPFVMHFRLKFFEGGYCVLFTGGPEAGKTPDLKYELQDICWVNEFSNPTPYVVFFSSTNLSPQLFFPLAFFHSPSGKKSMSVYLLCVNLFMCTHLRGSWSRTLMKCLTPTTVLSFWIICIFFIWLFDF